MQSFSMRPQLGFTDRLGTRLEPLSSLTLPRLRAHLRLIHGRPLAKTGNHLNPLRELLRRPKEATRSWSRGLLFAREDLIFKLFERNDDLAMQRGKLLLPEVGVC